MPFITKKWAVLASKINKLFRLVHKQVYHLTNALLMVGYTQGETGSKLRLIVVPAESTLDHVTSRATYREILLSNIKSVITFTQYI